MDLHKLELDDAVLDPTRWPSILDRIARSMRAEGGAMLTPASAPDLPVSASVSEAFQAYYGEGWFAVDPRRRAIPTTLIGGAAIDQDIITRDEMKDSAFYNDLLARFDLPWWCCLGFSDGHDPFVLSLFRRSSVGPFERQDAEAVVDLARRLNEVATLSHAAGYANLTLLTGALEGLSIAAATLDRQGRVLSVNLQAQQLFGNDLSAWEGKPLFIRDPKAAAAHADAVERLPWLPEGAPLEIKPIVVRRQDREPVVLRLTALNGATRAPFGGARGLLTFTVVTRRPALSAELISDALHLTPAEARLAARLAAGASVSEAAFALGITDSTARTHLKAIFNKTGTGRQGELISLLSALGT